MAQESRQPSTAVDVGVFTWDGQSHGVLLVRRRSDPYKGYLALPGGFLEIDETLMEAVRREVEEETGVSFPDFIFGRRPFDAVDRDPRGRVISFPFATVVRADSLQVQAGDDAAEAGLFKVSEIQGHLAFDHDEMLRTLADSARRELDDGWMPFPLVATELVMLKQALSDVSGEGS